MAVALETPKHILPIAGVKLAAGYCGIRSADADDLVLFEIAEGSQVAASFTRNAFCAAPVLVAQDNLSQSDARYLLINAGNANAGTGVKGLQAARQCCEWVAQQMGVAAHSVLPFSTGVIGEYLPVEKIAAALPSLNAGLKEDNWLAAARGIMTTDTVAKGCSEQLVLECGTTVTVSGISKGAGMICPDMATMLAYIATDAAVEPDCLQTMLTEAVAKSFNSISVDGDTSTNDACVLMATAKADNPPMRIASANAHRLQKTLNSVMQKLAQAIVRDAEGATKFVSIDVQQARDVAECKQLAYSVAHSPLVKTALFASDPNWGRILAAIGRAGLHELDLQQVSFSLNGVSIVKQGERDPAYTEEAGAAAMGAEDIALCIQLGRGAAQHTVWTCDLSYDYVKINAEYRT